MTKLRFPAYPCVSRWERPRTKVHDPTCSDCLRAGCVALHKPTGKRHTTPRRGAAFRQKKKWCALGESLVAEVAEFGKIAQVGPEEIFHNFFKVSGNFLESFGSFSRFIHKTHKIPRKSYPPPLTAISGFGGFGLASTGRFIIQGRGVATKSSWRRFVQLMTQCLTHAA